MGLFISLFLLIISMFAVKECIKQITNSMAKLCLVNALLAVTLFSYTTIGLLAHQLVNF